MKKMLSLALALALTASLTVNASAAQEVIGHALYTDIVTEIDAHPIASYNVGGRTAVMVQDLNWYGFYVYWNEEGRSVYVWPGSARPGGVSVETPEYVPQPPEGKVGDAAYPIYASDIKVYVAGEEKESFNIGGHVMVYLSDLLPYGELNWNQEEKLAQFQVAEDPVKLAMDRLEEELNQSGLSTQFECYPGPRGALAVYTQGGTPHGSACMMLYVDRSGKQTRIDQLLPVYGFGQQYYLIPRDIAFDETSDQLTFITPVKSEEKDWGDTRCTFDTASGKIVSMEPLSAPLEQWDMVCESDQGGATAPGKPLLVEVGMESETHQPQLREGDLPWKSMCVTINNQEITIAHYGDSFENNDAPYSQAYRALADMGLPDVTKDGFVQANTPEQRAQAGQYFQVTKNGQSVPGVLWWSQGSGHRDLKFTFDQNVSLAREDVVRLWVGVPEEN